MKKVYSYGNFLGGDPRNFRPDPECSTEEERQRHSHDCYAWTKLENAGIKPESIEADGKQIEIDGEVVFIDGSSYGLGVNEIELTDEEYDMLYEGFDTDE